MWGLILEKNKNMQRQLFSPLPKTGALPRVESRDKCSLVYDYFIKKQVLFSHLIIKEAFPVN